MSDNVTTPGLDESFLEAVARCLDSQSVRALGEMKLTEAERMRLDTLARKANEGQLTEEEAREYDRFIELGDIVATLRLKAERQVGLAHAQ